MPSAQEIKKIRSLKEKKDREDLGIFLAETPKVVADLILGKMQAEAIYVVNDKVNDWQKKYPNETIQAVSEKELQRISFLKNPNEVVAVFKIPNKKKFIQENFTLLLDEINDPGNMGTILRTANWFGIKNIICSKNCVDVFHPKVVQSTMGSLASVNVYYFDSKNILSQLSESTEIYGADAKGDDFTKVDYKKPLALVIGSEAHGIQCFKNIVKKNIAIRALNTENPPESLNAAIATSILISGIMQKIA